MTDGDTVAANFDFLTDLRERLATVMADANAETLGELPANEQGRYRRMARAAIAALPPAVPALITQMQDAARNYLEPTAYERRRPGGTCLHDSRVDMPAHNHTRDAVAIINRKRDAMFINDLIYFLDSEKHGTNTVPQCIHMTAEMAQNCPICNPSPDARASDLGSFLPQCDEVRGPALGVELSDSSAQGDTTPDPVAEAAKVLLANMPNPVFDNLKPVLMGEFGVTVEGCDEDGEECHYIEPIGWSTIKDILLMAVRALTKDGEAG